MQIKYFVGVDGGGTKTAFAVSTADGAIIATHQTIGCSYQALGTDAVIEILSQGVRECLASVGANLTQCAGCCLGIPCYGEDADNDRIILAALQAALAPAPIMVVNDVEVGWAGSLKCSEGIHIVAGTGSIAFGRTADGKTARCGGWNEFFGDEGSCYWVGRETMNLFSKEVDGRALQGALYDIVRQELGFTDDERFVDIVTREFAPYREKVAGFQKLTQLAADAGDPAASALYEAAATELALMAATLQEKLFASSKTVSISYSGGLFKAGDVILKPLEEKVEALGCTLKAPCHSPIEGALILAIKQFD